MRAIDHLVLLFNAPDVEAIDVDLKTKFVISLDGDGGGGNHGFRKSCSQRQGQKDTSRERQPAGEVAYAGLTVRGKLMLGLLGGFDQALDIQFWLIGMINDGREIARYHLNQVDNRQFLPAMATFAARQADGLVAGMCAKIIAGSA